MGKPSGIDLPPLTEKEKQRQEEEKSARLNDSTRIDIVDRAHDIPEKYRAEICCYCGKIIGWSGHWIPQGPYGSDRRLSGFGFAEHQNCNPHRGRYLMDFPKPKTKYLTNGEFYKNLEESISKLKTPAGFIIRQIRNIYFIKL